MDKLEARRYVCLSDPQVWTSWKLVTTFYSILTDILVVEATF